MRPTPFNLAMHQACTGSSSSISSTRICKATAAASSSATRMYLYKYESTHQAAGSAIGTTDTSSRHKFYSQLLAQGQRGHCPALFLAPMESLMDRPTRLALLQCLDAHKLGTFDEACTEFIRVPATSQKPFATVKGITAEYRSNELQQVPLAAQLMGSNAELLAAAAIRLVEHKGAPRIDLNCGCPANVVTGGGAGSSLLREPGQLHHLVAALVAAVGQQVPVTVKMRSGFDDTSLFQDNLRAVQDAGASFVTIHPRTKHQSYNGRADWSLVALAKDLLDIPVVGNGDILCVSSALEMLQQTGCDGLMIGRGALQDPLLFHRIRSHFAHTQQPQQLHQAREQVLMHNAALLYNQQQQGQGPGQCLQLEVQPNSRQMPDEDNSGSVSNTSVLQPGGLSEAAVVSDFLTRYASYGFDGHPGGVAGLSQSGRLGRLKKVMKYIFSGQPVLRESCSELLRAQPGQTTADQLLDRIIQQVQLHWREGGPPEKVLVSHMTMPGRSKAAQTWQQATLLLNT